MRETAQVKEKCSSWYFKHNQRSVIHFQYTITQTITPNAQLLLKSRARTSNMYKLIKENKKKTYLCAQIFERITNFYWWDYECKTNIKCFISTDIRAAKQACTLHPHTLLTCPHWMKNDTVSIEWQLYLNYSHVPLLSVHLLTNMIYQIRTLRTALVLLRFAPTHISYT